mgnify:CR=1 FL=1
MVLGFKITCTCKCHQAKIKICCQMPLVAPIAQKIYTDRGVYQHAEYKFAVRGNQTCSLTTSGIQALNIIIIASLQLFSWLWLMLSLIVTNTQTDVIMQFGYKCSILTGYVITIKRGCGTKIA